MIVILSYYTYIEFVTLLQGLSHCFMLHRLQFRLDQINQSIMAESMGAVKCPCGFVLELDDCHTQCILCLGVHDMSQCSVCKSLSTTAKAYRKRAYNNAFAAGFIVREGKKYPFPPVPPGTPGISSQGKTVLQAISLASQTEHQMTCWHRMIRRQWLS